jgi:hypothetical protein
MSKLREFIENWNEFLPESRITEEEMKNIQESTFRSWLIILLKKLNVDTVCFENMNRENGITLRTSRLRLLSTVNHFLAITGLIKLNYTDLLSPGNHFSRLSLSLVTHFSIFRL